MWPLLLTSLLGTALSACGSSKNSISTLSHLDAYNYGSIEHLQGSELKNALHEKVRAARKLNYNQVWVYLKTIDQDPGNPDHMIMVYSQRSLPYSFIGGGESAEGWNREHVWPSSRGFSRTDMPAHTDLHNLRPCEVEINRLHGDLMFGEAPKGTEVPGAPGTKLDKKTKIWEPADAVKGDIARILMYMDIRYQGNQPKESDLRLLEKIPAELTQKGRDLNGNGYLGNLSTLLRWHRDDPVDQLERERHQRVYEVQGNRNPFIDRPEFADAVYLPAPPK